MCSICRNKNCKYRFNTEKWKPDDDLVVIQLPDSDLPLLEQVRAVERFGKLPSKKELPRLKK